MCNKLHVYSALAGRDTPQYKVVLQNFATLIKTIESTPESLIDLKRKFITKTWLNPRDEINANQLIRLALNRVETDVTNYDEFMEILKTVTGMDQIVGIIQNELKHFGEYIV